jgi:hypothetical protein
MVSPINRLWFGFEDTVCAQLRECKALNVLCHPQVEQLAFLSFRSKDNLLEHTGHFKPENLSASLASLTLCFDSI